MRDEAAKDMYSFICISCILRLYFRFIYLDFIPNVHTISMHISFGLAGCILYSLVQYKHTKQIALEQHKRIERKRVWMIRQHCIFWYKHLFSMLSYHHQYFQCLRQVSRFLDWLCWRCRVTYVFTLML